MISGIGKYICRTCRTSKGKKDEGEKYGGYMWGIKIDSKKNKTYAEVTAVRKWSF